MGLFYFRCRVMANERLSSISGFIFTVFCLQVPGSAGITSKTAFFLLFYNYYYLFSFQNIHAALFHFIIRFAIPWSLDERYVRDSEIKSS